MAVQDVSSLEAIEQACTANPLVVMHFWASWCEPCKHMDAVLAQLSQDFPTVKFLRVEAEVVDAATIKYNIATVPSFVFVRGSQVQDQLEGADPAALSDKVAALQQLPAQPGAQQGSGHAQGGTAAAPAAGAGVEGRIKYLMDQHPVLLFMKGVPDAPRCGFSRKVVEALRDIQVPFHAVDILADEQLRAGVKAYSDWPTYPQLHVKGELVGGCDIVLEMKSTGDLEQLVAEKLGSSYRGAPTAAPGPSPAPGPAVASAAGGGPVDASSTDVQTRIQQLLKQQPVMLFMKGTPAEPRCGFSSKVVDALTELAVPFGSFDILSDEAVRQGLKEFSQWPTYPQLYVKSELLGGCDIVLEMKASGDLKNTIDEMLHRMESTD
ncbi:thioredoxin-like protein [Haematococcus lacustris]